MEFNPMRAQRPGPQATTPKVDPAVAGQTAPAAPPAPDAPLVVVDGAAGTQTVVGVPPFPFGAYPGIPTGAVDISLAFFFTIAAIIIGLPITRALARRLDKKSGVAQIPNEVTSQLAQLTQAVDAIALEVERISEGQRFTTRLLSEQRDAARASLPAGTNR